MLPLTGVANRGIPGGFTLGVAQASFGTLGGTLESTTDKAFRAIGLLSKFGFVPTPATTPPGGASVGGASKVALTVSFGFMMEPLNGGTSGLPPLLFSEYGVHPLLLGNSCGIGDDISLRDGVRPDAPAEVPAGPRGVPASLL